MYMWIFCITLYINCITIKLKNKQTPTFINPENWKGSGATKRNESWEE